MHILQIHITQLRFDAEELKIGQVGNALKNRIAHK